MTSRQRGAALLLAALVIGRLLDRFDLPFEKQSGQSSGTGPTAPDKTSPPVVAAATASVSPPTSAATPAPSAAIAAPAPAAPDTPTAPDPPATRTEPGPPVAINHATAADLQRLPGIGPVLASRIVADRAAHGPFRGVLDLQRVRGIGPKSAARLASRVRFD